MASVESSASACLLLSQKAQVVSQCRRLVQRVGLIEPCSCKDQKLAVKSGEAFSSFLLTMAQHDSSHVASSQKALMLEMKNLQEEPVEGFKITLVDEADLYNWEVAIFGPPNTHYEGGYFKVRKQPC